MTARTDATARSAAIRTFLIADIRGYTTFTTQRGDEAASMLATRFAAVCAEGVSAWGGALVELRGDEALAAFDSPRAALRCATELQAAFAAECQADPTLPLGVGIGLDAGEAVAVGDGYRGAALNIAARLCASAGAGEVLASESVVRLAGPTQGVTYVPLGPMTFKGVAEPMTAMRVEASSPEPSAPARPAISPETHVAPTPLPPELDAIVPLAGRSEEVRWLRWHLRRARHGDGRTVAVSGVPGIGKTRLAAELAAGAHGEGAVVRYLPSAQGADDVMDLAATGAPLVLVVDDLDAAATDLQASVARLADAVHDRAALLVLTHRHEAPPTVIALVERLTTPERRLGIGALEPADVRAICALYAGDRVNALPLDEIEASTRGVPAAVHRTASQLTRQQFTDELGSSARRTEAGRLGLRQAEDALIGDVADLELARERSRLYGAEGQTEPSDALTVCPYKGLASFEGADAEYYFGRERLVAELVARLVGTSMLGLVGASGSGKSSALRAGLLPALAGGVLPGSDRWVQVLFRPAEHPIAELGHALARALPSPEVAGVADRRCDWMLRSPASVTGHSSLSWTSSKRSSGRRATRESAARSSTS